VTPIFTRIKREDIDIDTEVAWHDRRAPGQPHLLAQLLRAVARRAWASR
jgi:hypothetical protein